MPTNIHLDYASPITIQIRVYDDRITIWNAVQLPPEWAAGHLSGNFRQSRITRESPTRSSVPE